MAFRDQVNRAKERINERIDVVMPAIVVAAENAIKFGSPVTGSPGQPVDTGNLRNSWQHEMTGPRSGVVSTNVEYAQAVEDGVGPEGARVYGRKNNIGGSHSVKQLVANFDKLVDDVATGLSSTPTDEVAE